MAQVFLNHRRFHAQPMGRYDHPVGSGLPHRLADLPVVEQSRNIAGWVAEEFIQEVTMRSWLTVKSGSSEVLTMMLYPLPSSSRPWIRLVVTNSRSAQRTAAWTFDAASYLS
jgi:hypothetical protein